MSCAAASVDAVPPPKTRACLAERAVSAFRTAILCCLSVNGCTPVVRSSQSYIRSWIPRRRLISARFATLATYSSSEAAVLSSASFSIAVFCAFGAHASDVQIYGSLATFVTCARRRIWWTFRPRSLEVPFTVED